jgi:AhpD family alkylhydroperoxidase
LQIIQKGEKLMQARLDYPQVDPESLKTMFALGKYVINSKIEQSTIDLVLLRASQINRCAYCIDMHFKDAVASGETEQRLYSLDAWRETPFYSERERAALAWTEAVTVLTEDFVPDAVYEQARAHFTEAELVSLTMAIIAINGWNRLNVSFRMVPGGYQSQRQPERAAVSGDQSGNWLSTHSVKRGSP